MNALRLAIFPLAGFALGWFASHARHNAAPPQVSPPPSANTTASLAKSETPYDEKAAASRTSAPVALRDVLSHPSELHRRAAFTRRLKGLGPAQFAALHEELLALPLSSDDGPLLAILFLAWARVAPEAAVEAALQDRDRGLGGNWGVQPALEGWAEHDLAAARARAETIVFDAAFQKSHALDLLLMSAMPKPGDLPPAEALRRIREVQGDDKTGLAVIKAMSAILREWAKTDASAAWREVLAMPATGNAKETRDWALKNMASNCAAKDPSGVAQWLAALDPADRATAEPGYVTSLAFAGKTNVARDYALAMPEGAARREALAGLANGWFQRDPEGAKAFVSNLPAADWRDPIAFADVFRRWASTEPERAMEVLIDRIPPDARVPDDQRYQFDIIFDFIHDPKARCDWTVKFPQQIRDRALDAAVARFCYEDAPASAAWAVELPPGAARDRALGKVAETWAQKSVTAAAQWLDTLPAGTGKSNAIESFARTIVSTSPDDAFAWLRAVPDEGDRIERLRRVWKSWADRDAAQRWLENSRDLTAAERAALLP